MQESEIWARYAEPKFVNEQKIKCEEKFKSEFTGLGIRDLEIHSQFSEIKFNVVYVPAFFGVYSYLDEQYVFVVNGNNGYFDGQRPPYGIKIGGKKLMYKGWEKLGIIKRELGILWEL